MLCATICRKLGFELGDFRTVNELAVRHHTADRVVERSAETTALRAEVNKRNGIEAEMLVHALQLQA
jgi:hypothetical protein